MRPGDSAGRRQPLRGARVHRRMRAAGELRFVRAGLAQDAPRGFDVKGLGVVRRGADRDLLVRQTEALDAAVLDERQRLEHLDRGAHEADQCRVARACDESTVRVHDRDVDNVLRFDSPAARDFYDGPHDGRLAADGNAERPRIARRYKTSRR